jgi:hypothetical protein
VANIERREEGAVEQGKLRERIEDFMRGYGLLWVLVIPSLGLAAIVVGWFLISSLLPPHPSLPARWPGGKERRCRCRGLRQ